MKIIWLLAEFGQAQADHHQTSQDDVQLEQSVDEWSKQQSSSKPFADESQNPLPGSRIYESNSTVNKQNNFIWDTSAEHKQENVEEKKKGKSFAELREKNRASQQQQYQPYKRPPPVWTADLLDKTIPVTCSQDFCFLSRQNPKSSPSLKTPLQISGLKRKQNQVSLFLGDPLWKGWGSSLSL